MARDAEEINPKNFFLVAHGRLKPGVTIANAETDLNRIETGLKAQGLVANPEYVVRVRPYRDHVVGRDMRRATLLLVARQANLYWLTCRSFSRSATGRPTHRSSSDCGGAAAIWVDLSSPSPSVTSSWRSRGMRGGRR